MKNSELKHTYQVSQRARNDLDYAKKLRIRWSLNATLQQHALEIDATSLLDAAYKLRRQWALLSWFAPDSYRS